MLLIPCSNLSLFAPISPTHPTPGAAAALDAADGVMDGNFFGSQIVGAPQMGAPQAFGGAYGGQMMQNGAPGYPGQPAFGSAL